MSSKFGFITCASDRMAPQLDVLLTSVRFFHPDLPIAIIPFSDQTAECAMIAKRHSAVMIERNPMWDELGDAIFGATEYRPGVTASHYFRKLNCLTGPFENFLYTDCNALIMEKQDEIVDAFMASKLDIVFSGPSAKGRTFRAEFRDLLKTFHPRLNEGYNAGYILSRRNLIPENVAKAWIPFSTFLRSGMGKAPEQGFLGAMIGFCRLSLGTVAEIVPGTAPFCNSQFKVAPRNGAWYYVEGPWAGRRVYALKWTGQTFPYQGPNAWLSDLRRFSLASEADGARPAQES